MKNNLTAALLIIAGAAALLFVVSRGNEPTSGSNKPVESPSQEVLDSVYGAKVDSQGEVTITVTPVDISSELQEWKFDVTMETHSVELDQDMVNVAMLVGDSGKEYKPLRWEGAPPGGHHREGVLSFNSVQPIPKSVEIKIRDIAGVPERSFAWDLK